MKDGNTHSGAAGARFEAGHRFFGERRIAAAIRCFDNAQELGFPVHECAGARWHCWMLLGRFERAWEESDLIERTGAPDPFRLWNGASWEGKRVVLRGLHGLGDTIQFIRYGPVIARRAQSLAVQVHPQLVTLIQGVPGVDKVYSWGAEADQDRWDVQIELTELPRIFRTTASNIPREIPYIRVPEERLAWSRNIIGRRRRLRVGLIWESGAWNPARSISLEVLEPLFTNSEYDFFALQKGCESTGPSKTRLRNPEIHSQDVRDTAALMQQMDLIISTDTMSAHLAGALGRPVWILLPFEADWRWMLDRDCTPWYPTARLFRQRRRADWAGVVTSVAERLSNQRDFRAAQPPEMEGGL